MLNNNEKVLFDDDIVLLLGEFIKNNKSVSMIERNCVPYLARVAKKN